jgi:hypothetical protein
MNEIAIEKDVYEELMALSRWYDAMPSSKNFNAGDRFHENFFDYQFSCIPAEKEDTINDEDHYFECFELTDEGLFVLQSSYDNDETVAWKIVPKG